MLDVQSKLEFLADLDLYKTQRPFIFTPGQDSEKQIDTGEHNLNTVELQYETVTLLDIRHEPGYKMQECGFELVANEMQNTGLNFLEESARNQYACETEEFWVKHLNAEYALCYDVKLRRNGFWDPDEPVDLLKRGWLEPPARGIHVDLTFEQAPVLITKHLTGRGQQQYLKPGFRIRIVNTWRPLLPVIEDNPLAFCDSRSVAPSDLVLADRVFPNYIYTLYFLKHNPAQRWHWVSEQTPSEIMLMLMYDTEPGAARFCAHGSFQNPLAPVNAPPRESIETRTIVISRE
ncbi:uncharacterized protein E0L32_000554 [Thyridium curvatum]|uniref:Methyltransferase n=1 Tax=Thyridium curvatum TaxID=1093900 RepID=A0A507BC18_9PEZI|nr:uncharacterized protein E0L32_000554 [Thyridium curvatum]TPX14160.1 hypothetical protein E0L32_000554 [Thyridium curvatum]